MFYDPHLLLDGVDERLALFILFSTISFVGEILWLGGAARAGTRDRCVSIPPFLAFTWLVHDLTLVAHMPKWFGGEYDHWLMQLYWVAMIATSLFEVVFVRQLLSYGRVEYAPKLSDRTYWALVVLALIGTTVIWLSLQRTLADPLYQVTFGLTGASFPLFGGALLLRRGDRRGQSTWMWWGYTLAIGGWWAAGYTAFGPWFRSGIWVATGVVAVGMGVIGAVFVSRTPRPAELTGMRREGSSLNDEPPVTAGRSEREE